MIPRPVIVLGDANVDMVIQLPLDQPEIPTLTPPQLYGGGTAANTAVALARLGVAVSFVGMLGDDGYGRYVEDDLVREGVDISGLCVDRSVFTPTVIALIRPDGERFLVVWPPQGGAHTHLGIDHLDPRTIQSAAWLHTTGMCLRASPVRETVLHAMMLAREAGATVSLDLNLRLELWGWNDDIQHVLAQALAQADVVFGGAYDEIIPLAGVETVEAAAHRLAAGRRAVVARMGREGTFAVSADGEGVFVPTFPVEVIDTLGAGDAFNGGFIANRIRGGDLAEAVRWGNATAALKITRAGARGLPTRAEVERLLGYNS